MGYRLTAPATGDEMGERNAAEMRRVAMRLADAVTFGMWTMALSAVLYLTPDDIADAPVARAPDMAAGAHVWFDTSVLLVTLPTPGRLVEIGTMRQSARAIAALPEAARELVVDGSTREVLADDLDPGARFRIGAGERVLRDDRTLRGASDLDTSVLTGEVAPRAFHQGQTVLAGFFKMAPAIEVEVTATADQRRIGLIDADIAAAPHDRLEIHRTVDRLARVIAPLAPVLVMGTLLWSLSTGPPVEEAGLRALPVLVIAGPCSVVLARP